MLERQLLSEENEKFKSAALIPRDDLKNDASVFKTNEETEVTEDFRKSSAIKTLTSRVNSIKRRNKSKSRSPVRYPTFERNHTE